MENAIIKAVILTLEDIEVHGSENLSKMLGCINALNQIIELNEEEQSENKDGETIDNG